MSSTVQLYPLLKPLTQIKRHDQLPKTATLLAEITDTSEGLNDFYSILKHEDHLSVLISYKAGPKDQYYCDQFDYPLKALSWFPWALEEFQKPPAEGGLHAGAMTTKDMDVDGEMLCIQSATQGYHLVNRSRSEHDWEDIYRPMRVSMGYDFLYQLGFLDLWKTLGEKYEQGKI